MCNDLAFLKNGLKVIGKRMKAGSQYKICWNPGGFVIISAGKRLCPAIHSAYAQVFIHKYYGMGNAVEKI